MQFESSHEAAKRLGVNVRTVQKWAKEGKIPGAKMMGKSWLIPNNLEGPAENPMVEFSAIPLMNLCYQQGTCKEIIDRMDDETDRNLALGAYHYLIGKPEDAVKFVEPYLYHKDINISLSASAVFLFASLSLGEIGQRVYGMHYNLDEINDRMKGIMNDPSFGIFSSTASLFQNAISALMHISIPAKVGLEKEIGVLPDGLKLFGMYTIAHQYYLAHEYERALGGIEAALVIIPEDYHVPKIFCLLMKSILLMSLKRMARAKKAFMDAWELAKPDAFIEPFAIHYGLLHGLAEACLKKADPDGLEQLIQATRRFKKGWVVYHEKAAQKVVADYLSTTEFSVAMMYHKAWSIKEIAEHLELSERMVKHHIAIVYEKLGVSNRDELSEYMPN